MVWRQAMSILALAAQAAAPTDSGIPPADRIRLAEGFRLADSLGQRLWPDWNSAPFAVLLVTPDREFLMRHPKPSQDFMVLGEDSVIGAQVWFRPRRFDIHLLATLPVGGIPTIVIGRAESTQVQTSTPWVCTLLHEHFHQLQYSRPGYYSGVNALGLSRGDSTGMWMLNFPFPYDRADVRSPTRSRTSCSSSNRRAKPWLRRCMPDGQTSSRAGWPPIGGPGEPCRPR